MFRNIPAVVMLILTACYCLPALSAQEAQVSKVSQFDSSKERIGTLRLGMTEIDLTKNIPCKPRKGKEILEGATGEYVQEWKYSECGIVLKMGSERKGGAKVVQSITITTPSNLVTSRGIHIGSMERELMDAYGRYRDPEEPVKKGKQFVAGSIYDGMIFDLKNGKVVKIFLGAAAE